MAGRVLKAWRRFGSGYKWKQDAGELKHEADATEFSSLTAQSAGDRALSDASNAQTFSTTHSDGSWFHRLRQRSNGWRFAALHFAAWAFIVFLTNLIVTIWASAKAGGDLSEGDCGRIKDLNRGLHILINILSTILLSGSNYCMQCLSAPTRADIDKAHETRTWLDVGIPSIRNLRHISRPKLCLWLLLGFSSIPLHLLYNSAIYATTSTNDYMAFMVNEAFLSDEGCSDCFHTNSSDEASISTLKRIWTMSRQDSLERLGPKECLTEYATPIQSHRRHVLLITDNNFTADTISGEWPLSPYIYTNYDFQAAGGVESYDVSESFSWICSGLEKGDIPCANRLREIESSSKPWTVGSWTIKRCLSEPVPARCKLRFSRVIAVVVTVLNLVKAVLMICVVCLTKGNPLLTMGDAVASFIDQRDMSTVDSSMTSVKECKSTYSTNARPWNGRRWRWRDTTSRARRGLTMLLYATTLIIVAFLLIWGTRAVGKIGKLSVPDVFSLGFGAVDTRALIGPSAFPNNVLVLALVANSPQVLLSFCYFAYNGLFTAMLMGYEWTSYADKQKGLRVSVRPTGSQRSTYFLQLPYRFGLPLVVLSGTLHWLVSQCIFVVSLDLYDGFDKPLEYLPSRNRCGYSPIAMLTVVIVGAFMIASIIGFGYIPYKGDMPLAASCSLAISAACHPQEHSGPEGEALSEQKLQWGVVSVDPDGIGHCAFSSKEVGLLVKGAMYR